ncbi:hypothetical protein AtNW77_Chr5g0126561 [Arabidopsis thaliana]
MTCVVPCDKELSLCSGESHNNEVVVSIIRRIEVEIDEIADYEFRRVNGIGKHAPRILCFPGHIENLMYL